jgi:predicted GH43/DUF377 family glycosyl hydrolase
MHKTISNLGKLYPIILNINNIDYPTLTNPSIININNNLLLNIRNTNYVLYNSENNKFPLTYGPIQYLHKENDLNLRTRNIVCNISIDNDNLTIDNYSIVKEIEKFDHSKTPKFHFVGLEDSRLIFWNDKLYLSSSKRDDNEIGSGRIVLSELNSNTYEEVNRYKIDGDELNDSYCEKNWMPILNKPYCFVRWVDP